MYFEQAFYTSCETGLRGSKGFQMNAASKGLDTNILNYLERCGGYLPPLSSPTTPTNEELEQFPISLSFYKTQEGFAVLSRSKYLGQDYSLRYGNFFTHFILSKDMGTFLKLFSPIAAWKASFWKEKSIDKTELPLLELPDENESTDILEIKAFLDSDNRFSYLNAFASSLQLALQTKRRIIIVDTPDSVTKWITTVAVALPNSLLDHLTFTTYNKNPYNNDTLICGTTNDSDFRFSQSEIAHQFYVFDFENSRFSDPSPETKFSKSLLLWYKSDSPSESQQFRNFTDWLKIPWEIEDLDHLIDLYNLVYNNEQTEGEVLGSIKYIIERNLYGFSAVLIPVTAVLSERSFQDKAFNSIVKSLFLACYCSPNTDEELKEDILVFYIDWFIDRILPDASEELLRDEANTFFENKVPKAAWDSSMNSLKNAIENSRDIKWLSAIIEFTKSLGLLKQLGPSIERIVNNVLLPNIRDKYTQNILGKLFEENLSPVLDGTFISLVRRQLEIPAATEELTYFLSRKATLIRLKALAIEKEDKLLYILINAFEISKSPDKVKLSVIFINDISENSEFSLTTKDYDKFFTMAWYGETLSPEETYTLINELPDVILESTAFIELAVDGLVSRPDILSLRENDPALLLIKEFRKRDGFLKSKAIVNNSVAKTYNKVLESLELPSWCKKYGETKSIPHKLQLIRLALKILSTENYQARQKISDTAIFDYLIVIGNIPESANILHALNEIDQSLLSHSINKVLSHIDSKDTICISAWVQLFLFIYETYEDISKPPLIVEQNEKHLRKIYSNLPNSTKSKIDSLFNTDKHWNQKWETWKNKGSGFSKFKKILFR